MRFEDIVIGFTSGDKFSLSKAISFVERNPERSYELISVLSEKTRKNLLYSETHIIGITGPPGIGKSTLISQIIEKISGEGKSAGVLLCDPSSVKVSGGAILGDRIRMKVPSYDRVFIRSVGTRGELGGISLNTSDIVNLFILFGMEKIIIETAGTGQTETEIYKIADTVVLVVSPESGDEIQFMKSGILEIADIIVLNKADRPSADKMYNEIKIAIDTAAQVSLSIRENGRNGGNKSDYEIWKPPVIKAIAKDGVGIDEIMEKIEEHRKYLERTGMLKEKRIKRLERDFKSILTRQILSFFGKSELYNEKLSEVLSGKKDPYTAVREFIEYLKEKI
jgi:LAO/AO transport system kinase